MAWRCLAARPLNMVALPAASARKIMPGGKSEIAYGAATVLSVTQFLSVWFDVRPSLSIQFGSHSVRSSFSLAAAAVVAAVCA